MQFENMSLIDPIYRAIQNKGYTTPTPIQAQAFPHIVKGKDMLGCAQTGTGKTAAFALPILQRLARYTSETKRSGKKRDGGSFHKRPIRTLVLSPTRELAAQIADSFRDYGQYTGLRHTVVYGGVKQGPQCKILNKGVDILVATPGRLIDLHDQGVLSLKEVEIFVLDEADRMLDMGFIHDIRRIAKVMPDKRQTLMFSATMPREIRQLADTVLHQPVSIKIKAESLAADTIKQTLYHVDIRSKIALLGHLLKSPKFSRTLIFSRTKRGADKIVKRLVQMDISAAAIHSDKSQSARMQALRSFKNGNTRVLVASDIAARGLDVNEISHVINYDLPDEAETYIHRIGRTGRAGIKGQAISFCCDEQRKSLRGIERLLGRSIPVIQHEIKHHAAGRHTHTEPTEDRHSPKKPKRHHTAKSSGYGSNRTKSRRGSSSQHSNSSGGSSGDSGNSGGGGRGSSSGGNNDGGGRGSSSGGNGGGGNASGYHKRKNRRKTTVKSNQPKRRTR